MSRTSNSIFKDYLFLIPLALLYLATLVVFSNDQIVADEGRYLEYATNLTNGFYTNPDNPSLRNGPGYPLLITPFVYFNAPHLLIKMLNPIMIILSLVLFFKTLLFYVSKKRAIFITYILGLYPVLIKWMLFMHSESLAIVLICGFMYYLTKFYHNQSTSRQTLITAGICLGLLALTKVIFGYVILALLFFCLLAFGFQRTLKLKNNIVLLVISFAFCIPYLAYTYSVTDKVFYWGSQSGEILYWRSTPFAEEYGDWVSTDVVLDRMNSEYFDTSSLSKNHGDFIQSLEPLSYIEKDEIFKKRAIENIKAHPFKYAQNTVSSGLRLFFNYPYSYTPQKMTSYFHILPNMFLVVFMLVAIGIAIYNKIKLPHEIVALSLFSLIFIGGLILSDGRVRHLLPIIPVLMILVLCVFKYQKNNTF